MEEQPAGSSSVQDATTGSVPATTSPSTGDVNVRTGGRSKRNVTCDDAVSAFTSLAVTVNVYIAGDESGVSRTVPLHPVPLNVRSTAGSAATWARTLASWKTDVTFASTRKGSLTTAFPSGVLICTVIFAADAARGQRASHPTASTNMIRSPHIARFKVVS